MRKIALLPTRTMPKTFLRIDSNYLANKEIEQKGLRKETHILQEHTKMFRIKKSMLKKCLIPTR